MKAVKILLSVLVTLCAQQVSAQQSVSDSASTQSDAVQNIGAMLPSVQTLKALVIEQIDSYEVSISGPSVLDQGWEKRQASGVYTPQTIIGPNLKELSELVASRQLQVAVSNPNDALNAYVSYFSAPNQNGARNQLFYGNQSFKLFATKDAYVFPDVKPSMRMVDNPNIRFPGVQLSSVKVTERSADGQIIDGPRYLDVNYQSGVPSVTIPAYLVEGERKGEIVFQYWNDNTLQTKVFDLASGAALQPSSAGGTVTTSMDGVIVVNDDDVILDLPEGGRVPLIQVIVPVYKDVKFAIRGIVNGVPEPAKNVMVRKVVYGTGQTAWTTSDSYLFISPQVPPGAYWVIPNFDKYGKNLPPEYYKPMPSGDGKGGGGVATVPAVG